MIKIGQECFIIENNRHIRPVLVTGIKSDLYTLKFKEGGGVRLRKHRIFEAEEEARRKIRPKSDCIARSPDDKGPYNYLH